MLLEHQLPDLPLPCNEHYIGTAIQSVKTNIRLIHLYSDIQVHVVVYSPCHIHAIARNLTESEMLKKVLKGILLSVVVIILGFSLYVIYRLNSKYEAPYPEIHAVNDSSMIARGKYLAYGPAHCSYCHAPMKDFARIDKGEIIPLSGGFDFKLPLRISFDPLKGFLTS